VPNLNYYIKRAKKIGKKGSEEELFLLKKQYVRLVKDKNLLYELGAFNTKYMLVNPQQQKLSDIHFCFKNND
jgi:hypothetical protein